MGWVCCWFSPLLQEVFLRVLRFSPLLKNQHFQIPIRSGTHGHVSMSSYELLSAPWVNKLQLQITITIFRNVQYMLRNRNNITYTRFLCLWPDCIQNKKKATVLDSWTKNVKWWHYFFVPNLHKHLDSIWSIGISKVLLTDFDRIGKTSVLCCPDILFSKKQRRQTNKKKPNIQTNKQRVTQKV